MGTPVPRRGGVGKKILSRREPVRGESVIRGRPGEGDMPERDDEPPKNVVPFANVVGLAIAQQLNEFYGGLLREELPDDLSALARELAAALAQGKEKT
jgi:hypothetical protein